MLGLAAVALLAFRSDGLVHPESRNPAVTSLYAIEASVNADLAGDDASYNYMPSEQVLVCACAKCGSTSLYDFLFGLAFDRSWNYTGMPFIQDVVSTRWENKWKLLNQTQAKEVITKNKTFSFALSRDPRSRIISGWKSKAACEDGWGTDIDDRARMVPRLLALADLPTADCLHFEAFVNALAVVHRKGLAAQLNPHFRPQQFGCFRDFQSSLWSKVAPISDSSAAHALGLRLGHLDVTDFPHAHSSPASGAVNMTDRAKELLEEITRDEYAALANAHDL